VHVSHNTGAVETRRPRIARVLSKYVEHVAEVETDGSDL
jgi:hypothetical protein